MSYWDDYRRFKPSIPREAKGGIKAQSKRGTFGESWWARRWIAVLESFNIGARLGRGRSYARRGQVLSIEIDKGKVSAKVQGSRPKPYHIKLEVKTLSASDWSNPCKHISAVYYLLAEEFDRDPFLIFKLRGMNREDLITMLSRPDKKATQRKAKPKQEPLHKDEEGLTP